MLLVNKEVLFGSTALYFVKFQMLQIKISGIINTNSVRDAQISNGDLWLDRVYMFWDQAYKRSFL